MKVVVENLDDLWHIYNLISKDDIVYARTTREIKAISEEARPGSGRRISMTLGLKVTDVSFDKTVNRLRVRGIVVDTPERYEGVKGSFHTISTTVGDSLTLIKSKWDEYQLRRVKDASEVKMPPVIIVTVDDEDACVSVLGRFGFDVKFEKKVRLPGKLEPEKRKDALQKYFKEISQALLQTWLSVGGQIVILGPGFIKNEYANYVQNNFSQIYPAIAYVGYVSCAGVAGVSESLRSGILTDVIKKSRVLEEMKLVEDFLADLASNKKNIAYGLNEVKRASSYGAVKTLIVADKYLREISDHDRLKAEELMKNVEKTKGKVVIISSEHEGGEKILSLGGIAAILRYPI